jgi:hypothetical protein
MPKIAPKVNAYHDSPTWPCLRRNCAGASPVARLNIRLR